jgi:hypothetical protein
LKTIPESDYIWRKLKLNCVIIKSQDLVGVCSKIDKSCGEVSIVKGRLDGSMTMLECIEDVTNHIEIVHVPFKIIGKGISVDFSNLGVSIEYRKTEELVAQSIFATLRLHSPIILNNFFTSAFFLVAIALFISLIANYVGDAVPIDRFPNIHFLHYISYFLSFGAIAILLMSWPTFGFLVQVSHRRSDSFFQRNKDRIIFSVLSFIFVIFTSYFLFPFLNSFLGGP